MLMQILVVSVFTLVYTNQVSNIREIGLEQSNVYPSVPDTRLLIEKRDGTEFTASELSYFENLRKVNYVYENAMNFYNQNSLNIQSDYQYGNVEGTDTALSLSLKDIDGRLPIAVNEVVISSYYDQFSIGDAFKLTNGYGYYGPEFDAGGQPIDNSLGTFIVVGIDKQERRIIYFSDAYLKTDYPDQILIDSDKYYQSYNNIQWSMGFNYLTTSVYLQPAWEPQTEDILIQGEGSPTILNNQTLTFSSKTSTGSLITQVVTGVSISVPTTFDPEYAVAFMSEDLVAEVMAVFMDMVESEYTITPSNMISLSVDGYYAGNSVIRNVDSTIYKVYYPSNISGFLREFLVFFASLMALVFLSLFGMFLYSIVHAVTRNVMNARKKDFAIFRSIGANKTSLARLVVLEQVMMSTSGFIITIILLRILSSNVGFIKLSIQYMENRDYVILLTAFMLFGAWLGLRFNKKVFKQSVIETLSASREE